MEVKRCIECRTPVAIPGVVIAMEQREHFALTRNTQMCDGCATRLLNFIDRTAAGSRHCHQCINCLYCGSNLPITRLHFQIKDQCHRHVAFCEKCYHMLHDDLMRQFPGIVEFIELEWRTRQLKALTPMPWPNGSFVRVRHDLHNHYAGQTGKVTGFRPLVQPWFGYDVVFVDGRHHFFHERDLVQVATPDFEITSRLKDVG